MTATQNHLLLMTATITPGNAPDLARTDPSARLMDYAQALTFHLTLIDHPLDGIVFVENPDSDVSILRQVVEQQGQANRVEFLCNYGHMTYAEKVERTGNSNCSISPCLIRLWCSKLAMLE